MKKVKIKLVRSKIGRPKDQVATLKALKLNKINSVSEYQATPQILGMIHKVKHLVEIVK